MKASLREKNGYFYIVYSYKDSAGKHKQKWKATGLKVKGNKRLAEKMLHEANANQQEALEPLVQELTMPDLVKQWLSVKQMTVRKNTYTSYADTADQHVIPYFEDLGFAVSEVTPAHIQRYYTEKAGKGLSPGSLTRHRTIIRDSLNYAIQTLGILQANPADRVKLPKGKKRVPSFYKLEELRVLFRRLEGESIEPAARLAVYFGLRRSEVLGLRWSAVDWKRRTLEISHTAVRVGSKTLYDDAVKEKASFRTIPIFPEAEGYLKKLHRRQKGMEKLGGKNSGYICCWDDGQPLDPDYVTSRFRRFLKEQNLRHIRFHDLRHSTASLLINNRCTLRQVQEYLGHAKAESTEIYAHMLYESKLEMADKLNHALSFGSGEQPEKDL